MADKKIRRGPSLQFDEVKEKDIIEEVERYSSKHKLGELMTHLFRIYFDSPELYNDKDKLKAMVEYLNSAGITPQRRAFFNEVRSDLDTLHKQIDEIYKLAYSDHVLAKMGNRIGLEDRSKETLRAQFLLQRRLRAIEAKLDDYSTGVFASELKHTEEEEEKILEHIILSYSGIISELKAGATSSLSANDLKQLVDTLQLKAVTTATVKDKPAVAEEFVDLTERPEGTEKKKSIKPHVDRSKFMRSLGRG